MQTISPQKSASPRIELYSTVPHLTSTTHFLQPPVYLNSLTDQRFAQALPWQNPHDYYFPQSLLLQPLNHLLILLHHLLGLIHTSIICTDLYNNRVLLTSLLYLWNHLLDSSSRLTHRAKPRTLLL